MPKRLWINAKETVYKSIGLEIGEDISQEDADKLIKMCENEDEFKENTSEYDEIKARLGRYSEYDTDGLFDVEIGIVQD